MIISNDLNLNGYYINNEIWFNITEDIPIVYFKIYLQNLSNGKQSTVFISYVDQNNNSRVNLQPIIKSLFSVPNGTDNNSQLFKINIQSSLGTSINFNKTFIRGGIRSNDVNQNTSPNKRLRLSNNIPIWLGFPVTESFLNPDYTISTTPLANITDVDYKRTKGCNNIYFKFLNQLGGYSYWVFESYGEKETGTNVGSIISGGNELIDLGNISNSDLQVFSKIPKEYKNYAKDFIVSPDVYVWQNAVWKKVFTKNNNIEIDNIKKVYTVNFNLDLKYRFNPSLLWSN
jgi:hypothetical protein